MNPKGKQAGTPTPMNQFRKTGIAFKCFTAIIVVQQTTKSWSRNSLVSSPLIICNRMQTPTQVFADPNTHIKNEPNQVQCNENNNFQIKFRVQADGKSRGGSFEAILARDYYKKHEWQSPMHQLLFLSKPRNMTVNKLLFPSTHFLTMFLYNYWGSITALPLFPDENSREFPCEELCWQREQFALYESSQYSCSTNLWLGKGNTGG